VKCLQIFYAVINDFELLLDDRHPLGKIVVLSDLAGQLVNLGVGHGLSYLKALLHVTLTAAVTYDNARQGDEACQYAYRARYHGYGDLRVHAASTSSK
jgi:hypothetical protein